MRHHLHQIARRLALLLIAVWASNTLAEGANEAKTMANQPSFAFYYGTDIPWESLGAFDVAVVEPGNVRPAGWAHRLNPDTTVAAYIAVGEVHPTRAYFKAIRPEWKLGENKAWGSIVVDQAAPGWPAFYLAQVIKPLWDTGYRAFFLDTLDSFRLVAQTPEAQARQVEGMATLVKTIKRAYPDAKLIFNRGFEILPEVHSLAYAVAAESLYQGWDAGKQQYVNVPVADRDWILGQLRKCQNDYQLPVIAIDYVSPDNRALARETAQKIKALGIIPWVTDPALSMMGVGQVEVLPRQVLMLHDEPGNLADVANHEAHRSGSLPLNYLGMDVRYAYHGAAEFKALAAQVLAGRYAGIVTWFNRDRFPESSAMLQLLASAKAQGVPVVVMNAMPGAAAMTALGTPEVASTQSLKVSSPPVLAKLSPHIGFEIEPLPTPDAFVPRTLAPNNGAVWMRWQAQAEGSLRNADVVAVTPWGGFAAGRSFSVELPQNFGTRWVINPIEFFKASMRVDTRLPVPDVSTETGRRMLLIHVDGDGFPSRAEVPGTPLAPQVMLSEFLERYRWPSTISIIEAEVAPVGLYAALSPLMEKTARQIFALPHVEMASHTYSHPFYWADAELGVEKTGRVVGLKVPGYTYNAQREIAGARDYIDTLAPPGKKTRVVLWSGNTQPLDTPVRLAYEAGLLNMNGGFTTTSVAEPSLTLVAPLGMMKGEYFQAYAPMQNENFYTNSWTGPFYGFERVIETFNRTESPQRLKPVNIYYHAYIATKRASIASLHKVYGWAEDQLKQQRLTPVYSSEYILRVLDWRRATVASTSSFTSADSPLELRGGRHLRQWRVDASAPLPRISAEAGLAGYTRLDSVNYVNATKPIAFWAINTTAGALNASETPVFYVVSANSSLTAWSTRTTAPTNPTGTTHTLRFHGHVPLNAWLHAPGCTLQASPNLKASRQGDRLDIESTASGHQAVVLRCPG